MPGIKKVLIVEDDKSISDALRTKLDKQGFETKTAYNGEEALRILENFKYDLVLLDLIMPKLDGMATLQRIKDKGIKTKVIVLSNLGQEQDKEAAKRLGAIEYFVKAEISLSEIVDVIKKL